MKICPTRSSGVGECEFGCDVTVNVRCREIFADLQGTCKLLFLCCDGSISREELALYCSLEL